MTRPRKSTTATTTKRILWPTAMQTPVNMLTIGDINRFQVGTVFKSPGDIIQYWRMTIVAMESVRDFTVEYVLIKRTPYKRMPWYKFYEHWTFKGTTSNAVLMKHDKRLYGSNVKKFEQMSSNSSKLEEVFLSTGTVFISNLAPICL